MKEYVKVHDLGGKHYISRPIVIGTNGNKACALFYRNEPSIQLVFKDYDRLDTTWDYYVAYCNQIPVTQLRNGTWPPDSTMHLMTFEQKPMVAFYRNEARFQKWDTLDSVARAMDSFLLIDTE